MRIDKKNIWFGFILSAVLLIVSLLSMQSDTPRTSSSANTSAGTKIDTKASSAKKERLVFWHGMEGSFKNNLLAKKIKEFNESSKKAFIVAQNYGAADQLPAKIMSAVAGGQNPDILWWAPQQFGVLADSDLLLRLDELINNDKTFDKSDIHEALWDASTINGSIYSIPFETNNLAIYYNKKLFQQAGIQKLPQTWEELEKAAEKLTHYESGDTKRKRFGFQIPLGKNEWTVWTWQTFLWQAGGQFYDINKEKALFDSNEGEEALNFWIRLMDKGIANFSEPEAGYKLGDFLTGKVAMMINGPWNYHELKNQDLVDYGSFALPSHKKRATNIGGEHIAVFASTEEKHKAAWEFAKFITSPEFQIEWSINTGYIPVSKKAASSDEYKTFLEQNPFMKTFSQQMNDARARPSITNYNKISGEVGKAIEKALYKKTDAKEALEQARKSCCP